ncbi:hypothetical protein EQG49_10465 [Periweissella cryptocerci]|uniref:Uncharacterized protein n=1 Tax=Periweissella cryptocerci TaxID=2506420 RepID=A0A4P6YVQ5_9LACO|nr:hypothetical protein [Periweissella cryptocerci]QBO36836.1 hypothetical protein EQG49_10465 [Periweissella cryptocerci]
MWEQESTAAKHKLVGIGFMFWAVILSIFVAATRTIFDSSLFTDALGVLLVIALVSAVISFVRMSRVA